MVPPNGAPPAGAQPDGGKLGAKPGSRWPDLRKRVISAALLLPVVLGGLWLGGIAWMALMALALALLAWEWTRICGFTTARLPGLLVPVLILAAGALAVAAAWGWAIGLLLAGGVGLWAARRQDGVWLAFGVVYIGLAGIALLHLRGDGATGRDNVLFLFLVVWASDIGAYLAGRAFGGPKLAPAISPNKTWSGAAGGLVLAMLVGLLAATVMGPAAMASATTGPEGGLPVGRLLAMAAGLGVLAQAGDLFESWLKRRFNVKDSSALIPGHGGLLDRLDAVLSAAPAAALLGVLLGPGLPLWH